MDQNVKPGLQPLPLGQPVNDAAKPAAATAPPPSLDERVDEWVAAHPDGSTFDDKAKPVATTTEPEQPKEPTSDIPPGGETTEPIIPPVETPPAETPSPTLPLETPQAQAPKAEPPKPAAPEPVRFSHPTPAFELRSSTAVLTWSVGGLVTCLLSVTALRAIADYQAVAKPTTRAPRR